MLVLSGAAFLATVLWSFFPQLLGLAMPPANDPLRLAFPAFVALAAGVAIGVLAPTRAVRLTQFAIGPGILIGGLLGLLAALRPHHLLIVLTLAIVYDAAAVVGAMIGRALGPQRAFAGASGGRQ